MAQRVLIVEDEKELAEILGEYLSVEGYQVCLAFDGKEGLEGFDRFKPDLVLLDIMLPLVDGISLCKKIREQSDTPIVMLSAKSGEMDKVICLGSGADDYVTKPFSPLELVARVKAHLRRFEKHVISYETSTKELKVGRLTLNKDCYGALIDQEQLGLTTKEFEVLYFLSSHCNQVFTKEQIYDHIWGMSEFGDISSVVVYIKRLREKLRQYEIDYIKTIWGVGYKLTIS